MNRAVLRYEWRRITSVRSTWIIIALFALFAGGIAFLSARAGESDLASGRISLAEAVGIAGILGTVLAAVLGAQAIGQEYRFGLIRLTLTSFPKRLDVAIGKTLVVAGFLLMAILAGGAGAIVGSLLGGLGFRFGFESGEFGLMLRVIVTILGYGLIGLAIAGITRNVVLGVVIPIVAAAIIEPLVPTLIRAEWLTDVLPFTNASLAGTLSSDAWRGLGVFVLWVAAAWLAWLVLFIRRDA